MTTIFNLTHSVAGDDCETTHFSTFNTALCQALFQCGKIAVEYETSAQPDVEIIETEEHAERRFGQDAKLFKLPMAYVHFDDYHCFSIHPAQLHGE